MYFFILHLSIADLLTAFLSVLPQLSWDITFRFQGGNFLCKVVKFGQTLGPYLSSYVLMATAVDRHQAVCHPLTYCSWTSRRSKLMVYAAWIASLSFCVPQVSVSTKRFRSKVDCILNIGSCWKIVNISSTEINLVNDVLNRSQYRVHLIISVRN